MDFARQVAEQNAQFNPAAARKFRSTAAPKGTKLKSGYQDRTQLRTSTEENDKASRVKALEDMVKLGQMDMPTFEALRDKIVGGDVKDVHLVKGLDWKLLERVRKGEDVLADSAVTVQSKTAPENSRDISLGKDDIAVDEELELVEDQEVLPVKKEAKSKKGEMALPPALAKKKRNRDEILKELKASRLAAAEKAKLPSLGPRFTKFGEKKGQPRIERDERGREVLITVDVDGKVKRKVKRAKTEDEPAVKEHGLLMPAKDSKPLGMEVTPLAPPTLNDEDGGDIFEGVGDDYNPLGDVDEEDSDESDSNHDLAGDSNRSKAPSPALPEEKDTSPPKPIHPPDPSTSALPTAPSHEQKSSRNYFSETSRTDVDDRPISPSHPLTNPAILAALKRAATITPLSSSFIADATTLAEEAKIARRKKLLESHDRDEDDMDMGFGGSRFEDGEDGEDDGKKVKLSVWGQDGGGEEGGKGGGGKGKRKRAPKKRKGDANNAADVLKVMERRKAEGR